MNSNQVETLSGQKSTLFAFVNWAMTAMRSWRNIYTRDLSRFRDLSL